jgi:hypothetical protein
VICVQTNWTELLSAVTNYAESLYVAGSVPNRSCPRSLDLGSCLPYVQGIKTENRLQIIDNRSNETSAGLLKANTADFRAADWVSNPPYCGISPNRRIIWSLFFQPTMRQKQLTNIASVFLHSAVRKAQPRINLYDINICTEESEGIWYDAWCPENNSIAYKIHKTAINLAYLINLMISWIP